MNTKLKTHLIRQRSLLALLAEGKKTYDIQRYKDLGEMNSEKLWETTLDPAVRRMLKYNSKTRAWPMKSSPR